MVLSILEQTQKEIQQWCEASGFARFHAQQILQWVYRKGAVTFEEMTDLPRRLRDTLAEQGSILTSEEARREQAPDGTRKLLLRLRDGLTVECVLIPDGPRRTACISTQVGCAVRCVFCASGTDGVQRNLTAGEIVEQVIHLKRALPPGRKLSNLVYMGMGEPLHNLTHLLRSLEILTASWGIGLGVRRITVSTSGPPGSIPRLARAGCPVHLAISLHAPEDGMRRRLIPGRTSSVADLLTQSREYFARTGRRVTFEIVLVDGINSDVGTARILAGKLKGFPCLVNLIPLNPVEGMAPSPPSTRDVTRYRKELERAGIEVAQRKRMGSSISAACGQLRLRSLEGESGDGIE